MKQVHAEIEKQGLMVMAKDKELVNEWNPLEERPCQYEDEKAEGEVSIQKKEFSDFLKENSK